MEFTDATAWEIGYAYDRAQRFDPDHLTAIIEAAGHLDPLGVSVRAHDDVFLHRRVPTGVLRSEARSDDRAAWELVERLVDAGTGGAPQF